jgi:hypothetical protein
MSAFAGSGHGCALARAALCQKATYAPQQNAYTDCRPASLGRINIVCLFKLAWASMLTSAIAAPGIAGWESVQSAPASPTQTVERVSCLGLIDGICSKDWL